MDPRLLNTVGLSITIVGCVLLFQFGLPPDVNPKGTTTIVTSDVDTSEIAKARLYSRLGRLGIALVAAGSLLQILAVWS